MISVVLIDIDDTLLDFNLCAKWAMEETVKKMKLSFPEDTYDYFKKINASLWKQMEKKEITSDGIIRNIKYMQQVMVRLSSRYKE